MQTIIHLDADLRARLAAGYESERDGWGDEYTDACLAKLAAMPDGPHTADDDDIADHPASDEATDLTLSDGNFLAIGLDYFGLDA